MLSSFVLPPVGGMQDIAISNSGESRNESWDIVWECRCRINEDNWTAEIAIPFSQLRFERSEVMSWGINLGRSIARKREISAWYPPPKAYGRLGVFRTAYMGSLVGIQGIRPSRPLELLPYISPGASHASSTEGTQGVF